MDRSYLPIIQHHAKNFNLEPNLVRAVIQVESEGDTWAARFEPGWKWFVSPKTWAKIVKVSQSTETVCQAMSFGLMQVMGAVARELGMTEDLTKLCSPDTGIYYGCKKLRKEIDRWGSIERGLAAYNAGSPNSSVGQQYAKKVLKIFEKLNTDSQSLIT